MSEPPEIAVNRALQTIRVSPAARGCYERGFEAGIRGVRHAANPYRIRWAREAWELGHRHAGELLALNLTLEVEPSTPNEGGTDGTLAERQGPQGRERGSAHL